MKLAIVVGVGCFVAQEIPVRPGIKELLVGLARQFARRDRDRSIRKARAQCTDDIYERGLRVFPALQDEGAVAQVVALFATGKDLFRVEAVATQICIGRSDPTVVTIVLAIVRVFDEATQEYLATIMHIAHRTCALEQMRSEGWIVLRGEERDPFFALERLLRFKLFDQAHRVVHAHFRYASFVRHQASDYTPPKDDKLPGRSTPFYESISGEGKTRGSPLPCSRICFADALMRRCFTRVLLLTNLVGEESPRCLALSADADKRRASAVQKMTNNRRQ